MKPAYAIAQSVPRELRDEVAEILEHLVAAYPTDKGPRAQAVADVLDALRGMR